MSYQCPECPRIWSGEVNLAGHLIDAHQMPARLAAERARGIRHMVRESNATPEQAGACWRCHRPFGEPHTIRCHFAGRPNEKRITQ